MAERTRKRRRSPPRPVVGAACARCKQPAGDGRFCRFCGHALIPHHADLRLASVGRRIGTYFLDLLIGLLTLGIGWLIWLAVVAPAGQTPAMSLLKVRCVTQGGRTASAGPMWLREL